MIKVKMLITTAGHLKDKEYHVLEETAKRWQEKGIAKILGKKKAEPAPTPEPEPEVEPEKPVEEKKGKSKK